MPTINKPGRARTQRREADDRNRADRSKIYNTVMWKRLRRAHLMGNPLCEVCEAVGRTEMAVDVHHLRSFAKLEGMATSGVRPPSPRWSSVTGCIFMVKSN